METETINAFAKLDFVSLFAILIWVSVMTFVLWKMISKKFDKVESEFKDVKNDLRNLSDRVSRIEGTLYHLYNPNVKTGTHE
jgi:energy-converting hydrogenase Eha subunit H